MTHNTLNHESLFSLKSKYYLDTVAMIFPLTYSNNHRSLVRLSVSLNETIDVESLQLALDRLAIRFPSFYVRLNQDMYNYYFEKIDFSPQVVVEDETEPLSMTLEDLRKCAFKVLTKENQIIFEYFHGLTDGFGGSLFLETLILEYLSIKHNIPIPSDSETLIIRDGPKYNEIIDTCPNILRTTNKKKDLTKSYLLKGKDEKIHITEFVFNADELLTKAKEYNVTLTAFLSGILAAAIFDVQVSEGRNLKDIKLSIPVDLRKRFVSETLRNFTLPSIISAGKISQDMTLADLCQSFDRQIKDNIRKEKLSSRATSYIKLKKNIDTVFAPLFLKKMVIRFYLWIFKFGYSMTFTNLGLWRAPKDINSYIKQLSIAISPKPTTPYSCGVASVNNTLTLTLTRSIKEPLLETRIISILNKVLSNSNFKLESII